MNRAILSSAIEGAVSSYEYKFEEVPKSLYPCIIRYYTAVTLIEPEFLRMEGRKHGKITYSVTLHLDRNGAKLSPEERKQTLATMEQELVDIFLRLSKHQRIAGVEDLIIEPQPQLDNHGALSLVATAEVVTVF